MKCRRFPESRGAVSDKALPGISLLPPMIQVSSTVRSPEERWLNAIANKVRDIIFCFASVGWQSFCPADNAAT